MNNPLAGTDPTGYSSEAVVEKPIKEVSLGSRIPREVGKNYSGTTKAGASISVDVMDNGNTSVKSYTPADGGSSSSADISGQKDISTKRPNDPGSGGSGTNVAQTPTDNSGFGVDDAASIGVGLTPAGIAADVYTAATGEDFFTGEEVSGFWRWAGLIPFVSEARKLGNAAEAVGDAATQTIRQSNHVSNVIRAPKEIPGISGLNRVKSKTPIQGGGGLRERWKDKKGKIYEWDSRHGELEMYNKSGKHLGSFDPQTGKQLGDAIKSRNIKKFL